MNTKLYIDALEKQAAADGVPYEGALVHFLDYLLKLFSTDGYSQGQQATLQHLSEVLREKPLFGQLAIRWLSDVADALDHRRWLDAFGTLYEEMFLLRGKAAKNGQFFTPPGISDLLSDLTAQPDHRGTVNDCAAGSGRLLLAHYINASRVNHAEGRKYTYIAQDSDQTAAKMCALNLMAHGMYGRVECRNTLLWNTPSVVYYINEVRYPIPTALYSVRAFSPNNHDNQK